MRVDGAIPQKAVIFTLTVRTWNLTPAAESVSHQRDVVFSWNFQLKVRMYSYWDWGYQCLSYGEVLPGWGGSWQAAGGTGMSACVNHSVHSTQAACGYFWTESGRKMKVRQESENSRPESLWHATKKSSSSWPGSGFVLILVPAASSDSKWFLHVCAHW
jgi:hypothetical protein